MALGLDMDYRLRWMDFDQYGRIQPAALLDILQDAATVHANVIGIGHDVMIKEGVFWAVIRSKYEIVKPPVHHQVVKVITWPHSLSRFSFIRDFYVQDDKGDLLVKATTEWVLMDAETRKFASAKDDYHGPTDFSDERAFEKKPRKVAQFEDDGKPALTVVPSYSDIDLNGHVNNAMYANYVVDALNPGPDGAIKTFQIDYRSEVLPDAPLAMYTSVSESGVFAKGVREDGAIAFACAIEVE